MKKQFLFLTSLILISGSALAQENPWSKKIINNPVQIRDRAVKVSEFNLIQLNLNSIKSTLENAPKKFDSSFKISFPNANGGFDVYKIKQSATMHPDLQNRYKNVRAYEGVKVDDSSTSIKFTIDDFFGLNASISSHEGLTYIDSYTKDNSTYIVYDRKNAQSNSAFNCLVKENEDLNNTIINAVQSKTVIDGLLRTYRLAITTTTEYSNYMINLAGMNNGTVVQKKAAILAAVNLVVVRLNQVFEKDLSLRLQLIANTDLLFFIDTDTFDASNAGQMIDENVTVTTNIIGDSNYDIGHVFFQSSINNGLAYKPSICNSNVKAGGVTGNANPIGDTFTIDFVAHEMGHQFGADHTQNNSCNRSTAASAEPGSASTIMGYAGICSPNVQSNSDAYFHSVSIRQMYTYLTGNGNCGVNTATNNAEPVVNAGLDYTIPISTPFVLTGVATDANNDNLQYTWEQIDLQVGTMPPRHNNVGGPMFRSITGTASPMRYFPKLATVIEGYDPNIITASNQRAWEKLPSVTRELNFSLLVRDNRAGGGQTGRDDVKITSNAGAGPFTVSSQNTAGTVWNTNSTQTITWNVANTNNAPVNTANVQILLSTDGGLTFPTVIVASTPNNGSYSFTVPTGWETSSARIMVKSINNVFYNVNTTNFTISTASTSEIDRLKNAFNIYPNPSNGIFTLDADTNAKVKYSIVAMDGKLINAEKNINSFNGKISEKINLSHLPNGVYLIKIEYNGESFSKKLIIKK